MARINATSPFSRSGGEPTFAEAIVREVIMGVGFGAIVLKNSLFIK
jgi:hypothetical protein